jgi:hypothetical protein
MGKSIGRISTESNFGPFLLTPFHSYTHRTLVALTVDASGVYVKMSLWLFLITGQNRESIAWRIDLRHLGPGVIGIT